VVDGGKGQVSAAHDVIRELNLSINIIGLAKRLETIVIKTDTGFTETNLDKSNEGLKLLQRLRDEAHRFAQAYHHKLMLKRMTPA
jgi:excinuclease ABC subunit C